MVSKEAWQKMQLTTTQTRCPNRTLLRKICGMDGHGLLPSINLVHFVLSSDALRLQLYRLFLLKQVIPCFLLWPWTMLRKYLSSIVLLLCTLNTRAKFVGSYCVKLMIYTFAYYCYV